MLVNRKSKWKSKFVAFSLATAMIVTAGSASAASKSASLDGSSTYKNTVTLAANNDSNGKIYATNNGANTTTRGYAKRPIAVLPDSTVASTIWLNPGTGQTVTFKQNPAYKYYGQIVGQTVGSRGSVTLTVY